MEADQVADMPSDRPSDRPSDVHHATDISADGVGTAGGDDMRAVSTNSEPTFKPPPPVQRGMSPPTFKLGQGKPAPPRFSESEAKLDSGDAPRCSSSASTGACLAMLCVRMQVQCKARFLCSCQAHMRAP